MALLSRNDEQIKVGTTVGLTAGLSSFVFNGLNGTPDYRGYEILIFEYAGRSPMIKNLDYSWDYTDGIFTFLQSPFGVQEIFQQGQWYTVQFQNPVVQPVPPSPSALIDWTYFIRNINIPNIDPSKATNAVTYDRLSSFIQKYEPECLRGILGYNLYKLLLTTSSQRMNDLIYGAEYTDWCGNVMQWEGLIQPTPKISLIANYIYYFFQEAIITQTTGVTTVIPKGDTAIAYTPADKMLNAWNFFSEQTKDMVLFLWNQNQLTKYNGFTSPIYPEFTERQRCKTQDFSRSNYSPF